MLSSKKRTRLHKEVKQDQTYSSAQIGKLFTDKRGRLQIYVSPWNSGFFHANCIKPESKISLAHQRMAGLLFHALKKSNRFSLSFINL